MDSMRIPTEKVEVIERVVFAIQADQDEAEGRDVGGEAPTFPGVVYREGREGC
jgi:hypothetical protein